jgi:hypothetical protein
MTRQMKIPGNNPAFGKGIGRVAGNCKKNDGPLGKAFYISPDHKGSGTFRLGRQSKRQDQYTAKRQFDFHKNLR